MSIESAADFDGITRAGRVVAEALEAMRRATHIGVTTGEVDDVGAAVLKSHGATSAPQTIYGCPTVTLISVNNEIVHGLPGTRVLQSGDVINLTSQQIQTDTSPRTRNGCLAAHHEHTIIVTNSEPIIVTML